MFDVGFSELLLLAIVALVVLGPEKLPHAARVAGAWVARIRRTLSSMQAEIEREVEAQELKTRLKKEFGELGGGNFVSAVKAEKEAVENTLHQLNGQMRQAMAPVATDAAETAVPVPAASVLAQAATPPEQVQIDGEKAYREWLEAQRRPAPVTPPATPEVPETEPRP